MVKYIDYDTTNNEECPKYFLSLQKSEKERTFLIYIQSIQDIVIKLKYNVEVLNYMSINLNLEDNIYETFFMLLMENISAKISIDIRSLLEDGGDQVNLNKLVSYCRKNPAIFKYNDIVCVLKQKLFSKSKNKYKDYFYFPSNKVFAHNTQEKLDEKNTEIYFGRVRITYLDEMLKEIMDGLNAIWFAYCQNKLCFKLKNSENYVGFFKKLK